MEKIEIYTEEPREELWRSLMRYSYPANIERHLSSKDVKIVDQKLVDYISGCFSQAKEYFQSAYNASLQISPLLLYYGSTNLMAGAASLISGSIPEISNHGMRIHYTDGAQFLADNEIVFEHSKNGGIHVLNRIFGNSVELCGSEKWTIKELLGSVVEIMQDFINCYGKEDVFAIPIQPIKSETGIHYQVHNYLSSDVDIVHVLERIPMFSQTYLRPSFTYDNHVVLRKKMNGQDITCESYSGQKYLLVGHDKNGSQMTLDALFTMYIILFALGSICRYKPQIWNPFVKNDTTGERLIIEKSINYITRILPNLVLNQIDGKTVIFLNERNEIRDKSKVLSGHEIEDLIDTVVRRKFAKERGKNNGI